MRHEVFRNVLHCLAALALAAAGACGAGSAPAAPNAAPDLPTPDAATSDAVADAAPWLLPELDPALCGTLPPMAWQGASAQYVPVSSGAGVIAAMQGKNWYLLTLLQTEPYRSLLAKHPGTAALSAARSTALQSAKGTCGQDGACLSASLGWTPQAIAEAVTQASAALVGSDLVAKHLRPSGAWTTQMAATDEALLQQALTGDLMQVQRVFGEFSASGAGLPDAVTAVAAAHSGPALFFEPTLWLAVDALHAAGRDQAGRYEPLATGENAAAVAAMAAVDWNAYRFAVILVPGWGPNDLDSPLSETGKEHCDLAAERWHAKVAPFVLVSGGHVHPDDTPYAEALEMKKYLVAERGLPAAAVLVDPHARHTTTNLRNAARIALRSGVPADKPWLVTTDLLQSFYILNLAKRCLEELGYLPWRHMVRVGDYDNCWLPAATSLSIDARDERDP